MKPFYRRSLFRSVFLGSTLFLTACAPTQKAMAPIAVSPYQAGDDSLKCSQLNAETAKLNVQVARLIERNELAEKEDEANLPTENAWAGAFGVLLGRAAHNVAKDREQVYGTEAGQLIRAHQERIDHLEQLQKSKRCQTE
jgi:hypothetical protein